MLRTTTNHSGTHPVQSNIIQISDRADDIYTFHRYVIVGNHQSQPPIYTLNIPQIPSFDTSECDCRHAHNAFVITPSLNVSSWGAGIMYLPEGRVDSNHRLCGRERHCSSGTGRIALPTFPGCVSFWGLLSFPTLSTWTTQNAANEWDRQLINVVLWQSDI